MGMARSELRLAVERLLQDGRPHPFHEIFVVAGPMIDPHIATHAYVNECKDDVVRRENRAKRDLNTKVMLGRRLMISKIMSELGRFGMVTNEGPNGVNRVYQWTGVRRPRKPPNRTDRSRGSARLIGKLNEIQSGVNALVKSRSAAMLEAAQVAAAVADSLRFDNAQASSGAAEVERRLRALAIK